MNGLVVFAMGVALVITVTVAVEFLEELVRGERFQLFR